MQIIPLNTKSQKRQRHFSLFQFTVKWICRHQQHTLPIRKHPQHFYLFLQFKHFALFFSERLITPKWRFMLFLHSVNKPWENTAKIHSLKEIRQSHKPSQDRNRHLCCWIKSVPSKKSVITKTVAHLRLSHSWRMTSIVLLRDDSTLSFRSTSNSLFLNLPQPLSPPAMQVLWKRGITLISRLPLSGEIGQGESSVNKQYFLTDGCSVSNITFPFTPILENLST